TNFLFDARMMSGGMSVSGRRVVVTGMGAVTPLGNTVSDTWKGLVEGRSGISMIDTYDVSNFATRFAGLIRNLDVTEYISAKEARKIAPFIQYGLIAGIQAIRDSGLDINDGNRQRIGVAVGSGIRGIGTIAHNPDQLLEWDPLKERPFQVPGSSSGI